MILSHKFNFVFIRPQKVAGSSIEYYLGQQCGPEDVITNVTDSEFQLPGRNYRGFYNPLPDILENKQLGIRDQLRRAWIKRRKYYDHMPADQARRRVGKRIWNRYLTFTVTRNPFDLLRSHYHYTLRNRALDSFDEYLQKVRLPRLAKQYTDRQGAIIVDRVIRYENLDAELGDLFQQLGVPYEGALGVHAKSSFRKERKPLKECYTREQQIFVEEKYALEFSLHGYSIHDSI